MSETAKKETKDTDVIQLDDPVFVEQLKEALQVEEFAMKLNQQRLRSWAKKIHDMDTDTCVEEYKKLFTKDSTLTSSERKYLKGVVEHALMKAYKKKKSQAKIKTIKPPPKPKLTFWQKIALWWEKLWVKIKWV